MFNSNEVERVSHTSILGLTCMLKPWHMASCTLPLLQRKRSINRRCAVLPISDLELRCKLFDSLVLPCLHEHEESCLSSQDNITKELKWQSGAAAIPRIQQQYPTKQKQMNKQFLGEAIDKKQLTCVLNKETGEVLNDSDAVLEYVHSSFQEQAKPASGAAKTRAFKPNEGDSKYPWKRGAYSSIDPLTLETAAER